MDFTQALILSIVEGITEFLPVSSTGHLILVSNLLQISQSEFVKSFEIFIQLGAILAVVVVYWEGLFKSLKVWKNVIAAFIPTAIIGLLLYKLIKSYLLGNSLVTVLALLIGGILIIILEKLYQEKTNHTSSIESLSLKQSVLIGVAQALSVIPGVSRSAASIFGAMFLGVNRETAVNFSFLLAIPTLLAATTLDLMRTNLSFDTNQISLFAIGFIGSFITALLVIKWFVKYVQTNNFIWFGVYRIIVALLFWLIVIR